MYEVLNIKTTTYMVAQKKGFFVDIQTNEIEETYEAYLWHKDYSIKELIFGVSTKTRFREFFQMVEDSIGEHIVYYEEKYMEE